MTALDYDPALHPAEQTTIPLRRTLTAYAGFNPEVAQYVAAETGNPIGLPARTMGFIDDEGRCIVFVLHSFATGPRSAIVSFVNGGLPLCRDVLVTIAIMAFDELELAGLVTIIRASDLPGRDALERLGFRPAVRLHQSDGERLFLVLTPANLPARYQRLRRRRAH